MKRRDNKAFRPGEKGSPGSRSGKQGNEEDLEWRNFPLFEKLLLIENPPDVLKKCELTCKRLDPIRKGNAEKSKEAELAFAAYGRSLDLLSELAERRDEIVEQHNQK